MKHLAIVALAVLLPITSATALAQPAASATATIERAIAAAGGADRLRQLKRIEVKGEARHWEPGQSHAAGGESRLAGDSEFVLSRDFSREVARIDWVRKLAYPSPREYRYSEVVTPEAQRPD